MSSSINQIHFFSLFFLLLLVTHICCTSYDYILSDSSECEIEDSSISYSYSYCGIFEGQIICCKYCCIDSLSSLANPFLRCGSETECSETPTYEYSGSLSGEENQNDQQSNSTESRDIEIDSIIPSDPYVLVETNCENMYTFHQSCGYKQRGQRVCCEHCCVDMYSTYIDSRCGTYEECSGALDSSSAPIDWDNNGSGLSTTILGIIIGVCFVGVGAFAVIIVISCKKIVKNNKLEKQRLKDQQDINRYQQKEDTKKNKLQKQKQSQKNPKSEDAKKNGIIAARPLPSPQKKNEIDFSFLSSTFMDQSTVNYMFTLSESTIHDQNKSMLSSSNNLLTSILLTPKLIPTKPNDSTILEEPEISPTKETSPSFILNITLPEESFSQ